ncbi:MAG: helix-turn-helix domain-containing protein [Planctomycetes bacterium]|nr:helix-turn-helix domain-containing protein [Planctomycetota bacterium]
MTADSSDTPGMEQFEWPLGHEAIGRAFEQLGPHMKRLLIRAWSITPWSSAARLAVVAKLHGVPSRTREAIAHRTLALFNPEPTPAYASQFVTIGDLDSTRFTQTFERVRLLVAPPSQSARDFERSSPPASPTAWPAPKTEEAALRQAAVAYFGRSKPFKLEEVADYFGVSKRVVSRWRKDLGLRIFVRGGVIRISVEDVYKLVTSSTV